MANARKKTPPPPPKPQEPRQLDEIQKEHNDLVFKAGVAQFHMNALEREVDALNARIWQCNQESSARQQLDAAKKTDAKEQSDDKQEG